MNIIPLEKDHLEDAAKLVGTQYRELRDGVPYLPARYSEEASFLPYLENITQAGSPGVAAVENGNLVGFMTGWLLASFRGERSVFSPEWANSAGGTDRQFIIDRMYSKLGKIWAAEKYGAHYITTFAHDPEILAAWNWLGFGMISVDAVRELDSIPNRKSGISIRPAGETDLQLVSDLHEGLRDYMKEAPILLPTDRKDRDFYLDWIRDPSRDIWLGFQEDVPAGLFRTGPADDDVCTIIMDEETSSIYAAFTSEECRDRGVGAALLDHTLAHARETGRTRCAVTFEPMNLIGSRFWLKYFTPVCYSVLRQIDKRLIRP